MAGNKRVRKVVTSESGEKHLIVSADGAKIPDSETKLLVGEVEKLTGVSKSKLRRYEDAGVLCPERTGEGVSNNRKLYGIDDLERLQAIIALREYGFSLPEIGPILNDTVDLYDALSEKLVELKAQENQLRNLGLFAHFAEASGADLIESLGFGPAEFDSLADLVRDTRPYEAAIAKLETYTDEEAERAFVALDKILLILPYVDENDAFTQVAELTDAFCGWWDEFVSPMAELGYLGFWAIYEDHTLVAERVEVVAGPGYVGFLEMFVFFSLVLRLIAAESERIRAIARMAEEDVVAAVELAPELIDRAVCALVGEELAAELSTEDRSALTLYLLEILHAFVEDEELGSYLGISEDALDAEEIEGAMKVVAVV